MQRYISPRGSWPVRSGGGKHNELSGIAKMLTKAAGPGTEEFHTVTTRGTQ